MLAGLARSGTTWLGKLFDSHPDVIYRHEPDSVRVPDLDAFGSSESTPENRRQLAGFVNEMLATRSTRANARVPFFRKRYFSSTQWALRVPMLHMFRVAARFVGELQIPEPQPPSGVRYVWKSVGKGAMLAGTIARAIPACHLVVIVRHPCGFVASQLRGKKRGAFGRTGVHDQPWAHERIVASPPARERGLTLDALQAASEAERLAWTWVWQNDEMIRAAAPLENARIVGYEALCSDPQTVVRDLFDFAGLEWSEQTERYIAESTRADRDSFYSLTKDPQRSAKKWRSELSFEDGEDVLRVVAPTALGQRFGLD